MEYNIDKNVKPKSWDGSNLPENLFNLVILDGSKRHQEGHQREYRRCLIGYLKRIVFKLIIGIERVEFYVNGWIRGRDSKLHIREYRRNFTSPKFIFQISILNYYIHAVTMSILTF